jgi:hypothetical protein
MRKWIFGLTAGLLLLVLIAGFAAIRYVRPERELDLAYENVSTLEKVTDMIMRRELVVQLTSEDVSQLVKKSVVEQPQPNEHTVLTGADFRQQGDRLEADVNVKAYGIPVGLHLTYELTTDRSVLTARPLQARIRGTDIPLDWLGLTVVQVDVNQRLPKGPFSVKELQLQDDGINIQLMLALR